MSVIDLECIKSDYGMECGCHKMPRSQLLRLGECNGRCFQIGLFFHLPPFVYPRQIKEARLFLFKLPQETCCCNDKVENKYCAYLLSEFLGSNCCFETLQFNKTISVSFRDKVCASYTEVDITKLVKAWVTERNDNKGILLRGCNGAMVTYASNRYQDLAMRPFVQISYEENQPLASVPCTVTVL